MERLGPTDAYVQVSGLHVREGRRLEKHLIRIRPGGIEMSDQVMNLQVSALISVSGR
jgi:hypothetical protein